MTEYGPHRDQDAPNAVVILGPEPWPQPRTAPMPAELVKQRRDVNELARQAGLPQRFDPAGGGRRG